MNNQRTVLPKSSRNRVDSRGQLGNPPRRRYTLRRVPHVADDHRDLGAIPVIPYRGEWLAIG
jgi:hypothetical protein